MKINWNKKIIICALMTIFLACRVLSFDQNQDLKMTYQQFRIKFSKENITSDQYLKRQLIFYSNMQQFQQDVKNGCSYCGVTQFFDLTKDEFRSRLGLLTLNFKQSSIASDNKTIQLQVSSYDSNSNFNLQASNATATPPTQLNWNDKGKVTSIKNQGTCGTCWSFATAAMCQSSLILKGQTFSFFSYQPDLSQQYLLTCTRGGSCNGGYIQDAIDNAINKGVPYQSKFPYLGSKMSSSICSDTSNNVQVSNSSRKSYYNINDNQIIQLLQNGPIAIAVSADNWQKYSGGQFYCASNAQINHAVLLVGYDKSNWIIKNQWGTSWGENGYIRITRSPNKNCRIGSAVHTLSQNQIKYNILFLVLAALVLLYYN